MPRSPRVVMIFLRDPQSIPSPPPSFHVSRLFFGDRYASAPVFSTKRAKVQIKCPSALLCCIFFCVFLLCCPLFRLCLLGLSLCLVASTSNIDKVVDLSPATPLPPPSPPQPFLPHHWPLVMSMRRRWKKMKTTLKDRRKNIGLKGASGACHVRCNKSSFSPPLPCDSVVFLMPRLLAFKFPSKQNLTLQLAPDVLSSIAYFSISYFLCFVFCTFFVSASFKSSRQCSGAARLPDCTRSIVQNVVSPLLLVFYSIEFHLN